MIEKSGNAMDFGIVFNSIASNDVKIVKAIRHGKLTFSTSHVINLEISSLILPKCPRKKPIAISITYRKNCTKSSKKFGNNKQIIQSLHYDVIT